jgi:uncharacterized protein (TIGR00106 family)
MSVLMQFAMFPTDKGTSVSKEVSRLIEMIRSSGVKYKLGPMGTTIETETFSDALNILEKSYNVFSENSERIYATISFDIRKSAMGRMEKKLEAIEQKIGQVNK